ncbi:MAG TPA: hypothetical protein VG916_10460 [Gemmatimonadaceae bacterium]|nr:hypothetical protein [Gemmatimonadaceae bacterium]
MRPQPRRGVALIIVLLVVLAVAAIASGAAFLGLNTQLIAKYHNRLSMLESVADAGLEQARSALNANKALYPSSGYVTYENNASVTDASGATISGVKRTTYIGPTGISTGQYGVFGSIVTVVTDANGNRIVRRAEAVQESFAKFAYFTDIEGSIVFGVNDILYGPVFSNDNIQLQSASAGAGATFYGTLKTAGTITNRSAGNYKANPKYVENAPAIAFPTVADLTKLLAQATIGGTNFTSSTAGNQGQASMRIEFVAVDLNGDGDTSDSDEGFIKVYKVANTANSWWVVADTATDYNSKGLQNSWNCGHILTSGTGNHSYFKIYRHHTGTSNSSDQKPWAINNGTSRYCYLGGSDILNDWTTSPGHGAFLATDSLGSWQAWTGTVDPRVTAARPYDAAYLWPISRALNPNFKGVIHVTGKVAISGTVRGKITLAATDNIIIADNIKYVTDPGGTVPCNSDTRDILGLFSGNDVIVANNMINAPWGSTSGGSVRTWANRSGDEYIHSVVLALSNFTVQDYGDGSTSYEDCEGANDGRGCLYLTGGIIQEQRGAVGLTDGHGYIKRYQYDACAGLNPPPYFPTTGRFARGHYYEVEPTNFNITTYWASLVP